MELTKDWRTDRVLRHLEALMIAVSRDYFLMISGNGDVIESDDEVMAIGSRGALCIGGGTGHGPFFRFIGSGHRTGGG